MLKTTLQGLLLIISFVADPELSHSAGLRPELSSEREVEESSVLKNCSFITNNCEVCSVDQSGKVSCSSVGIACQPTVWGCLTDDKRLDQ